MTCVVCGARCETMVHKFHADAPRPERWTIIAPLYFVASDDYRTVVHALCSAACSLKWHEENR